MKQHVSTGLEVHTVQQNSPLPTRSLCLFSWPISTWMDRTYTSLEPTYEPRTYITIEFLSPPQSLALKSVVHPGENYPTKLDRIFGAHVYTHTCVTPTNSSPAVPLKRSRNNSHRVISPTLDTPNPRGPLLEEHTF